MPLTPLSMLAGFGVGKALDYIAAEKQQSNFEENQRNQQDFTRRMAVDSTPLAALGMKKAGLNPATMSAPMSPVSAPSVSHGAAIPTDVTPLVSLANLEIQREVAMAQVDYINAETQHQRIINGREILADEDFNQAIIDRLEENKKMFADAGFDVTNIQSDIDKLKENPVNLGTFTANMAAIESTSKTMEAFLNKMQNLVQILVHKKLITNEDAINEMSKRDSRESVLLARKIGTEIAQKYYLTAETNKSKEELENLKKERDKIDAEIDNLGASSHHLFALANKVANSDVNTLIANGEITKAVTAELTSGTESLMKGIGQGAGAVAALRLGGVKGASVSSLGKMAMPQSVGKTTLSKTAGKVANKLDLSPADKRLYADLSRFYGERNARKWLDGYLNSQHRTFNGYIDAMQKAAKRKK